MMLTIGNNGNDHHSGSILSILGKGIFRISKGCLSDDDERERERGNNYIVVVEYQFGERG